MKPLLSLLTLAAVLTTAFVTADVQELAVGSTGPMFDYRMEATDGKTYTMAQVKKANGTLLVFTCNTCPWVHRWEDRYNDIAAAAERNGVGLIMVNPNEAIRNNGESMADMKARATDKGYRFIYALDKDHRLADAYGATRTPHVYLMDKDNKLVYVGAIDDNAQSKEGVENPYLLNALEKLGNGRPQAPTNTRALGCTIKRLS